MTKAIFFGAAALALTITALRADELPPEYMGRWGGLCFGVQRLDAVRDMAMRKFPRPCSLDYYAGAEEMNDPLILDEIYFSKTTVTYAIGGNNRTTADIEVRRVTDGYLITETYLGKKEDRAYKLRLTRSSDGREILRDERANGHINIYCRLEGLPRPTYEYAQLRCRR
jgi:hypothetical protein